MHFTYNKNVGAPTADISCQFFQTYASYVVTSLPTEDATWCHGRIQQVSRLGGDFNGRFSRFSKVRSPPIRGIKGPCESNFCGRPPQKKGRA